MSRSHGKLTVVKVGAADVSQHCKTSSLSRGAKTSDLTGYQPAGGAEIHGGGLKNAKYTMGGSWDDNETTGMVPVLQGKEGDTFVITRQLQGVGSGKPQQIFSAVLEKYEDTAPHDDYITWSADFIVTGPIDDDDQA